MGNRKDEYGSIRGDLDAIRTPWTMIERARKGDAALRKDALGRLYEIYCNPVRAYLGAVFPAFDDERVKDLAQDFFQRWLLEGSMLDAARREKGFRSFLKHVLRNRGRDEWDKLKVRRRNVRSTSDAEGGEVDVPDPAWERGEAALDRSAAAEYLERASGRVRARLSEERKEGHAAVFQALLGAPLEGKEPPGVRELAKTLGISTGSVSTYRSQCVTMLKQALYALAREVSDEPEAELAAVGLLAFLRKL